MTLSEPAVDASFDTAARLFRALGDAARLRLVAQLADGDACVSELAEATGDRLSTVSQRLRLLRAERLVDSRRDGRRVYYHLADDHVRAQALADAMAAAGIARATHPVDTNLVCFAVDPAWGDAGAFARAMGERGVLLYATSPTTGRLVTHHELDDEDVAYVIRALEGL